MTALLEGEFGDTAAWQELRAHVEHVFADVEAKPPRAAEEIG